MTESSTKSDAWIRRFHPTSNNAVRLVCFPHAGGSASFYYPISSALSATADVVAVQYPGRQDRRHEPGIDNMKDLADAIWPALRPLADRPMVFFGHSMGAVVAYEVALRLERDGVPPLQWLFVSGRRAPSRNKVERVHELTDEAVLAELRILNGTDLAILDDPETVSMVMPAIRNDYRLIESYRGVPGTLNSPIIAMIGDRDPRVSSAEAEAWAEHTTGPFDLLMFQGGHFYLVPQSRHVIEVVSQKLGVNLVGGAGDRSPQPTR
jgi:surfactin synthase thioesterase subunit